MRVLGRFELVCDDAPIELPLGSQQLLVLVALAFGSVRRDAAAGLLWPEVSERRAHANLRAALARLRGRAPVVRASALEIALADDVDVDLYIARAIAQRLLKPASRTEPDVAASAIPPLSLELLPGWYEDWVLLEAENWRQQRLHALEATAEVLAAAGRWGDAVAAAEAAVRGDPLRESARAALIRVHLAEGNQSEALREFERYRRLLDDELGLTPTPRLRQLLPGCHAQ